MQGLQAPELEKGGGSGGKAPTNFERFWLGKPCSELSRERFSVQFSANSLARALELEKGGGIGRRAPRISSWRGGGSHFQNVSKFAPRSGAKIFEKTVTKKCKRTKLN